MKRILLFILSILAFVGCSKDEIVADVVFDVSVSNVESYTATVTVTHDGSNRDTYYGFFVKGEVTDIARAISDYVFYAKDGQLEKSVHTQRKSVYTVRGLMPNTTYTYIVFGMDIKGDTYGIPASTCFTTTPSDLVATVNPNWKITYRGHTVQNDTDYSLINVEVMGESQEYFFPATYPESVVNSFETIESFLDFATSELYAEIELDLDIDDWFDHNRICATSISCYHHLEPGNYVTFAIGINNNIQPTGNYARSEVYQVEEYPLEPEYANLLGEWVLVDNSNSQYLVTFTPLQVNQSLIMYGWGNYEEIPICVSFDRSTGSISFSCQKIFEDYIHKFSSGEVYRGVLSFRGFYINGEGKWKYINNKPIDAALQKDGTYLCKGFNVRDEAGNIYEKTGMSLYMEMEQGALFFAWMMFPWTMEKKE